MSGIYSVLLALNLFMGNSCIFIIICLLFVAVDISPSAALQ